MTALKAVRVRLVRFDTPVPQDVKGGATHEWSPAKVDDLVVFPEIRQARCMLRGGEGKPIVATYSYYIPESLEEQLEFEGGSEFKCDVCGQTFENSQGLGKHRVTKHPEVSGK